MRTVRAPLDALLDDGPDGVDPVAVGRHGAQVDGAFLEAVQFVEAALDRHVADKVVRVLVLGRRLRVELEQRLPGERPAEETK